MRAILRLLTGFTARGKVTPATETDTDRVHRIEGLTYQSDVEGALRASAYTAGDFVL